MRQEQAFKAWLAAEHAAGLDGKIRAPADVVPHLKRWVGRSQEHFLVVTLSGAHEVMHIRCVSKGLVNRTICHPREVFRGAIRDNATAVILAHNHPSGALEPSSEDNEITRRMKAAGELVGIPVLDHVIVSKRGYVSYLEGDKL